jgi:hypothetical protein
MTQRDLLALQDRFEIADQLARYARAMDRCDHALGYSIFHPGAGADYGAMYQGTGSGFVDFALAAHKGMLVHSHQISNLLIELDGDVAASETYVTMMARMDVAGTLHDMRSLGRYLDRWEKREAVWRIAKRQYIHDFDDMWPVTRAGYAVQGRRDDSDSSYAVLNLSLTSIAT